MRTFLISLAFSAASAVSVQAQSNGQGSLSSLNDSESSVLETLDTIDDARGWEAVGRLDIDGKGFCTGALIAPDIVLTAAHCMFDDDTEGQIDPSRIDFLAGLRGGRPEASRTVSNAVVHPEYIPSNGDATTSSVRYDVALLLLDRPIRQSRVLPFQVSTSARNGTEVGVVSYAKDREDAASLQEKCNVIGEEDGVLFMDCDVNFGASGSPVFRDEGGVPRLVSVVSAMAEIDGKRVALGMDLAEPIATLRLQLTSLRGVFTAPPTSARIITSGQRNDTGALFVRP